MKSLIVVGDGIVGLSSAYYAVERGFDVTVVDKEPEGHRGCSWGNAGMLVPSHFIPLAAPGMVGMGLRMLFNPEGPFALKPSLKPSLLRWAWLFMRSCNVGHVERSSPVLRDFHLLSRSLYESFPGSFELEKKGMLTLCKRQKTLDEEAEVVRHASSLGLKARVLNAREVAELDPAIKMDVAGAAYFEQDCHLTPGALLDWLRKDLLAKGVKFVNSTAVVSPAVRDGRVVSLGSLEADYFVLATGAWTGELASLFGTRMPMQAGKGYSVTLPSPPVRPGVCSLLAEARVAITPMAGGSLRIGGTMELTGTDLSVNRRRLQGIFKAVPQYFPEFSGFSFEGLDVWSGLRPCSPDGLPYLGLVPGFSNVVVAAGHGMMGVSLGPATGLLVAQVLAGEKPALALEPFSPSRFA